PCFQIHAAEPDGNLLRRNREFLGPVQDVEHHPGYQRQLLGRHSAPNGAGEYPPVSVHGKTAGRNHFLRRCGRFLCSVQERHVASTLLMISSISPRLGDPTIPTTTWLPEGAETACRWRCKPLVTRASTVPKFNSPPN